jgi:type VI secretion system protein ImpC
MDMEPTNRSSGSPAEVTLGINMDRTVSAEPRPEEPFCVAVLGNFRGSAPASEGAQPGVAGRKPLAIDRDNYDDVLARVAPEVRIALSEAGPEIRITFEALDDFHPDRLYERLPLFRSLRELRKRLADPTTFRAAARELWGGEAVPNAGDRPAPPPSPPTAPADLLDEILGGASPYTAPASRPRDDLADYIRQVVASHRVPHADPRQPEALAQIDAAIGDQMRALLHHREFQALEALWRSVYLLVRRVETDTWLRIYLLDVAKSALAADLGADREFGETALHRLLVEASVGVVGGTPWSLLIGSYAFGPRPDDVRLLRRLGKLAGLAGAPWIAAADPSLIGCPSFGEMSDPDDWGAAGSAEWSELRQSPEAASIGLVLPRLLLRLPYGENTEPCELFGFEEADGQPGHEEYLWGNPAFACGLLLARSYASAGWQLRPGMHLDIGNLPLHLVRQDGETVAKPCAEALMTERAATRILDCGVMPLASMKDRDSVRLVRFQSIASPLAPLAARWTAVGR